MTIDKKHAIFTLHRFSFLLLIAFWTTAGLSHFASPEKFVKMMPQYLPEPYLLNILAGIAELVVVAGWLYKPTRKYATYFAIFLLVAFLSVHIYHVQIGYLPVQPDTPMWMLIARIPLQFLLMLWAWWHRE
ncbi:MAG: hypothetical protein NZM38_04325 [Cytophagales bacterium]|nr:hypothetical protein [Cytophagales bacterium]MDW8383978.1 hypothetical protein [Flammeovirgaceae bacterium]